MFWRGISPPPPQGDEPIQPAQVSTQEAQGLWEEPTQEALDRLHPEVGTPQGPWLAVPAHDIAGPVTSQGIRTTSQGDVMVIPHDLSVAGWLSTTAPLDSDEGTTLMAAHVSYNGVDGLFHNLPQVLPGDAVVTFDERGERTDWVVTGITPYPKTSLPADIYSNEGERRLVLATCTGRLVQSPTGTWHHEDNAIVTAVPVAAGQ